MRVRWIWFSLVSVLISLSMLSWSEHRAHLELQHNISTWVNRDISIESLSLGVFQSEIKGLIVPTANTTTFTNDIDIGRIQIEYTPSVFTNEVRTIDRMDIDRMTIHWNGLLGKNIQEVVGNITGHMPKSRRRKGPSTSPSTFEIKEVLITNTTIFVHIGSNVESIQIPRILLSTIEGTHQNILKQIIEQIRTDMKQSQAK